MKIYQKLLKDILKNGELKHNRTGIDTLSVFARQMRFDVTKGFPIVTTKSVYWKGVVHELLWFISGNTNIKYLQDNNVHIWDAWADENGDLGKIYGSAWRDFNGVDQLQNVIDKLRTNPDDRRLIVSAWDPCVLPDDSKSFAENVADGKQALPPCHYCFQFVAINGKLNLIWNQRSNDAPIGIPFNIASYALLLHMVAHITGLEANELVWSGADVHLYVNQIPGVKIQIRRNPLHLPVLGLNPDIKEIDDFKFEDIQLVNYNHHDKIDMGKVAV